MGLEVGLQFFIAGFLVAVGLFLLVKKALRDVLDESGIYHLQDPRRYDHRKRGE